MGNRNDWFSLVTLKLIRWSENIRCHRLDGFILYLLTNRLQLIQPDPFYHHLLLLLVKVEKTIQHVLQYIKTGIGMVVFLLGASSFGLKTKSVRRESSNWTKSIWRSVVIWVSASLTLIVATDWWLAAERRSKKPLWPLSCCNQLGSFGW